MSQRNVDLVKSLQPTDVDLVEIFTADNAGSSPLLAAAPDLFEDDFAVAFVAPDAQVLDYRGGEGFLAGWQEWLSPWRSYRMYTEDVLDGGDDIVAMVRVEARTARDNVLVEHAPAAIWSFRGGKVAAVRFYLERGEALRDAGLEQ
jgi:ketosteroid isomerase-like protein